MKRTKRTKSRVMLLETCLDTDLASKRSQIRFMREFFENFGGVELVAREVHSRSDLRKFLNEAKRTRTIKALHIVAHGKWSHRGTSLVLTKGESIDLHHNNNRRLFNGLRQEVLFLSCCELGRGRTLMTQLLRISGADAVFSYRHKVTDYEAFIVESLFYHLAYGRVGGTREPIPWREVYDRLKFALGYLLIDPKPTYALADPLLEAVFAED